MKKMLIGLAVVIALVAVLLQSRFVQGTLLGWYLPPFPQWPAPTTQLAADASGKIYYQTSSPFDFDVILNGMKGATPTTGLGYLSMPAGASADHPVAAMVILPGSGGIAPGREMEYAQLLQAHGIAAFVVDYYLPRGLTKDLPYIVKTSSVTEFDVITDAYSALKLLATSPAIDPHKIGVMGFSYGGMATRFAMDERFHKILAPATAGFAVHADFYGPCFQNLGTTKTDGAPLLTQRGTADKSNDLTACAAREHELTALGVAVEPHIYEGAGHAWEISAQRHVNDSPYIAGCEIHYDARGFSYINGKRIADTSADASRAERIAARLTSGRKYKGCLHYGYIIGRDEATTQRGYAALLQFLERQFQRIDAAAPAAPASGAG
jgi:dienelactone hydrolase